MQSSTAFSSPPRFGQLPAQGRAYLDQLLACGSQDKGSVSEAHRKALLFGASEYERLSKLPSSIVWLPEDLEKRAKAMRDLAAE